MKTKIKVFIFLMLHFIAILGIGYSFACDIMTEDTKGVVISIVEMIMFIVLYSIFLLNPNITVHNDTGNKDNSEL